MIFETDASSCLQPLSSLDIEDKKLTIESFTLLALHCDASNHHHMPSVYLHSMITRRNFWCLPLIFDLNPLSIFEFVCMKKREPLSSHLMISSKQVDVFVVRE